jgi:murein DD-endopeptidase MepM/ murein hydrolase activator NlpD
VQKSVDSSGQSYAQWQGPATDLVSAIMGGQGLVCTTSVAPFASGSTGDPFGGHCRPQVVQPYGYTAYEHPHHGVDLVCPEGTPLYSVTPGRVYYASDGCGRGFWLDMCGGGYGNWVQIQVQMALPGQPQLHTLYLVYAHMLKGTVAVKQGQTVQQGQLLGEVDSSGWSSADHLHFEVDLDQAVTTSSVDPTPWLNQSILGGQKTCVTNCA